MKTWVMPHGYVPMEELSGIREAGLSLTETALTHPLGGSIAADAAGVAQGWNLPQFAPQDWQNVSLDVTCEIPAKGNGVQPKAEPDGLFIWYRIEFELPGQKKGEMDSLAGTHQCLGQWLYVAERKQYWTPLGSRSAT